MAILVECEKCERRGGYAYNSSDTMCARCVMLNRTGKKQKDEDEDDARTPPKRVKK